MSEIFYRKLLYLSLETELKAWDESKHPREPAGSSTGGQFSNAVAEYQGTSFDAINNELRYDKPDKYKNTISELDKASTDVTDNVLYRGLDGDFTKTLVNKYKIIDSKNLSELQSKLVGRELVDKSFMSTSSDLSIAADFARDKGKGQGTILQISGKKQGINVSKYLKNRKTIKEKEFVIKRGSKMKIENVGLSKTGKLILYLNTL